MRTRELLANARVRADAKRCVSLVEMERWLQELAAAGILERDGDDWTPTPIGQVWLAPIAEAFASGKAVAA